MRELKVCLYGHEVGVLKGDDWRSFSFAAAPSAFEHFSVGSTVLSEAVPLDLVPNSRKAKQQRNFFSELLPEGRIRSSMAQNAGIDEYDIIGFLAAYGRDIAGALEIFDPLLPCEPKSPYTTKVSAKQIRLLLEDVANTPLANAPGTGKTSLGGIQSKIVLSLADKTWYQVHDGYPSTHILKPLVQTQPTMIFDELFGADLAHELGLNSYKQWIEDFDGLPALVIERYDRRMDHGAKIARIHQEDFNQILGAHGNEKYQEYGGKVSLQRIASVFQGKDDGESLRRLARQLSLAVAMGNLDMHAKNIGLIHFEDETSTLTPAYDMVPLCHQNTDGRIALAISGEYRHASLTIEMIIKEVAGWGLNDAAIIVKDVLEEAHEKICGLSPAEQAYPYVKDDIIGFIEHLLTNKPAGKASHSK